MPKKMAAVAFGAMLLIVCSLCVGEFVEAPILLAGARVLAILGLAMVVLGMFSYVKRRL